MTEHQQDFPRLIDTGRGFSVFYRNRYVYSQYNPTAVPEKTVQSLLDNLQPNTLILCYAPLLGYGLQSLIASLPDSCCIIAIEFDAELYRVSCEHLPELSDHFISLHANSPNDICDFLVAKGDTFTAQFRRCVPLELSGAATFFREEYKTALLYARDYLATFWKNRMTLIKLGKLYAANLLRNAALLPRSRPFPLDSIFNPVMVLGAGPSLDKALPFIRSQAKNMYIIAVESAVQPLIQADIYPDAIVAVESQLANGRAFVGTESFLHDALQRTGKMPLFFTDMTSRASINRLYKDNCCFFVSSYTNEPFFTNMINAGIPSCVIPPLGSVGLAALQIALLVAASGTSVFTAGLDFSFPAESTHAKGTPQYTTRFIAWNRLEPPGNPPPSLAAGVQKTDGKQNTIVYTDPSLLVYTRLANAHFGNNQQIYDIGETGIPLAIQHCTYADAANKIAVTVAGIHEKNGDTKRTAKMTALHYQQIRQWLNVETQKVTFISESLSNGNVPFAVLREALKQSSYLYLHFPDGCHEITADPSFLKRVKAETVFFLKQLDKATLELTALEHQK